MCGALLDYATRARTHQLCVLCASPTLLTWLLTLRFTLLYEGIVKALTPVRDVLFNLNKTTTFWQGLPFKDCARGCNICVHTRSQMSAKNLTKKILFERLYLVLGMGTFGPWVNCPYAPTIPTVRVATISRFPCIFSPELPLILVFIAINHVMGRVPSSSFSFLVSNESTISGSWLRCSFEVNL